jgi:hypothetical protein
MKSGSRCKRNAVGTHTKRIEDKMAANKPSIDSEAGYPSRARTGIDPFLGKPGDNQSLSDVVDHGDEPLSLTPESNALQGLDVSRLTELWEGVPGQLGPPGTSATAANPAGGGLNESLEEGDSGGGSGE